jgi:hypothetical protein
MKNINKFKKCALTLALSSALITEGVLAGINFSRFSNVYAYTPSTITISNSNFTSTSGSTYPYTPSSWSKADGSISSTNTKAGVINVDSTIYSEHYKDYGLSLTTNPLKPLNISDSQILMINSQDVATRYGFASSSFTLSKNSYYIISVDMKTDNSSSFGSLYLKSSDSKIDSSFSCKQTSSNWLTYKFFVQTNELSDETVTLECWLGSKTLSMSTGAVFFDNVSAYSYSNEGFNQEKANLTYSDDTSTFIDLSSTKITDTAITIKNANFDSGLENWTAIYNTNSDAHNSTFGTVNVGENEYNSSITGISTCPQTNGKYLNSNALYINNKYACGAGVKSSDMTFSRQTAYMVTLYAKSGTFTSGGVNISIVPTDTTISAVTFENVTCQDSSSNSLTNGWQKYTFFVIGSPFGDTTAHLEFWVGSSSSETKGYCFFDDVELEKVTYNQYTSASTSTTVKKISMSTTKDSANIVNGAFNYGDTSGETDYPLQPASWTANNKSDYSGIISTNKTHYEANKSKYGDLSWDAIGYTPLQQDYSDSADNNLLMIRNYDKSYQSYTSSSYSLSASSYYKVSVMVRTALTSGSAYITLDGGDSTIIQNINNIQSNSGWSTYTTYIKTGLSSRNISIILGLGKSNVSAYGYAFFDNAIVETSTADTYNAITNSSTFVNKVDLSTEDFSAYGDKVGDYYTPSNWTGTLVNSLTTGESTVNAGVSTNGTTNELNISSTNDVYYTYKSKLNYTIDSSKYYTLTVTLKTSAMRQDSSNQKTDSNGDVIPYGAYLSLSNSTSVFKGITKEEYTDYVFYIGNSNIGTTTLTIALGASDALTSGTVTVKEVKLVESTSTDFNKATTEINSENPPETELSIGTVSTSDSSSSSDSTSTALNSSFDWVLIPTIITALAIVIAVVGAFIRHTKFKKISFKQKSEYDRRVTLHPEVARREAEEKRKDALNKLNSQINEIEKQMAEFEKDYKEKRNKSKNDFEKEVNFRNYAKKRTKLAKMQEKLQSQKEEISSDAYLTKQEGIIIKNYEKEHSNDKPNNENTVSTDKEQKDNSVEKEQENNLTQPTENVDAKSATDVEIKPTDIKPNSDSNNKDSK